MKYQLCAYRQACNEMLEEGLEKLESMAILHLDKETGTLPVAYGRDFLTQ